MAEEKKYLRGQVAQGDDGYEWQFQGGDQTKRANWRRLGRWDDKVNQTEDVALSAGTGAAQGVEALGDTLKEGLIRLAPIPAQPFLRQGAEAVPRLRAPQYEPVTSAGQYVQSGTRGTVAGAPFGGVGAVSGGLGGLTGQLGSDLFGESLTKNLPTGDLGQVIPALLSEDYDVPTQRIDLARAGGEVIGALGPNIASIKAGPAARQIRRATEAMDVADSWLAKRFPVLFASPDGGPQWRAAAQAERSANDLGIRVTGPEALNNAQLLQQQLLLEQRPGTNVPFQQFMAQRPGQISAATQRYLSTLAPETADPRVLGAQTRDAAAKALAEAERARTQQVKQLYSIADPQRVPSQQIAEIVSDIDRIIAADKTKVLHGPLKELRNMLVPREATAGMPGKRVVAHEGERGNIYRQEPGTPGTPRELTTDIENLDRARKFMRERMDMPNWGQMAIPKEQAGTVGPLLRDLLTKMEKASDAFAQGRQTFADLSQPINAKQVSLTGQIAETADPVTQFNAMRDPRQSRPGVIRGTLEDIRTGGGDVPAMVRTGLENEFDQAARLLQGTGQEYAGARLVRDLRQTPQTRANIEEAVRAAGGDSAVVGLNKLLDALALTGNRYPVGSRTAFNQLQIEEMTASKLAELARNPAAGAAKWWDRKKTGWTAERLQQAFTSPRSVEALRELAYTKPQTARWRALTTAILGYQDTE